MNNCQEILGHVVCCVPDDDRWSDNNDKRRRVVSLASRRGMNFRFHRARVKQWALAVHSKHTKGRKCSGSGVPVDVPLPSRMNSTRVPGNSDWGKGGVPALYGRGSLKTGNEIICTYNTKGLKRLGLFIFIIIVINCIVLFFTRSRTTRKATVPIRVKPPHNCVFLYFSRSSQLKKHASYEYLWEKWKKGICSKTYCVIYYSFTVFRPVK